MKSCLRLVIPVVVLATAVFNVGVASAGSTASCGYQATPLFSAWNDQALYAAVQGSSFESGASGWSWGNKANVISGDSSPLLGIQGSHAVEIPGSGTAKSPWICVDSTTPSIRFAVRRVAGTGGLTVTATLSGSKVVTTVARVTGTSAWQPSPVVVLPGWGLTGSLKAQFLFVADPGTVYRIDDVYIDPLKRSCC
jgi:hypothetical protein